MSLSDLKGGTRGRILQSVNSQRREISSRPIVTADTLVNHAQEVELGTAVKLRLSVCLSVCMSFRVISYKVTHDVAEGPKYQGFSAINVVCMGWIRDWLCSGLCD